MKEYKKHFKDGDLSGGGAVGVVMRKEEMDELVVDIK